MVSSTSTCRLFSKVFNVVLMGLIVAQLLAIELSSAMLLLGNGTRTTSTSRTPTATPMPTSTRSESPTFTQSIEITPPLTKTVTLAETGSMSLSGTAAVTQTWMLTDTVTATPSYTVSALELTKTKTVTITRTQTLSRTVTWSQYPTPSIELDPSTVSESELRGDDGGGATDLTFTILGDEWDLGIAAIYNPPTEEALKEDEVQARQASRSSFLFENIKVVDFAAGEGVKRHIWEVMWNVRTILVNGNRTQLTLRIQHERNYELGQKAALTAMFIFSKRCFRNKLRALNVTLDITHQPRQPPVDAFLMDIADYTSLGTSAVNSLFSFNAMSTFQAARIDFLWKLHTCDFSPYGNQSARMHPFQDNLEDQNVQYMLGGCGFNTIFALAAFVIFTLFASFFGKLYGFGISKKAMALAFFPSLWYIPVLVYAQWTITMCSVAVSHSRHTNTLLIGSACLLFWIVTGVSVPVLLSKRFFGSWYVRDQKVGVLMKFLSGRGKWVDDDLKESANTGYTHMAGALFVGFRSKRYWFLAIDVLFSWLLGALEATQPQITDDCHSLGLVVAVAQGIYCLMLLFLRPFSALFDNLLFILYNFAQFASYIMLLLRPGPVGIEADIGYYLILVSVFANVLKTIVVVSLGLAIIFQKLICSAPDEDAEEEDAFKEYQQRQAVAAHQEKMGLPATGMLNNPLLFGQTPPILRKHTGKIDEGIFTDSSSDEEGNNGGRTASRGSGSGTSTSDGSQLTVPLLDDDIGDSASVAAMKRSKQLAMQGGGGGNVRGQKKKNSSHHHLFVHEEYHGMDVGEDLRRGTPLTLQELTVREKARKDREEQEMLDAL